MQNQKDFFRARFEKSEPYYRSWIDDLTQAPDSILAAAKDRYSALGPTLAYAEEPDHPMAFSLFTCAALLCLYLELKVGGVDVHLYGARMLQSLTEATRAAKARRDSTDGVDLQALEAQVRTLERAGERSQQEESPGQFVFDVDWQDDGTGRWTMEMTSCGICHLFGQHDALELVPYMCATDDVMSDLNDEGLRRTGTIALGRRVCDFHYRPGRPTVHLAREFPERIRII